MLHRHSCSLKIDIDTGASNDIVPESALSSSLAHSMTAPLRIANDIVAGDVGVLINLEGVSERGRLGRDRRIKRLRCVRSPFAPGPLVDISRAYF